MPEPSKQLAKKSSHLAKKIGDRAVELQDTSSKHVNRYLTRRSERMHGTWRFAIGWLALVFGVSIIIIV